MHFHPDVSANWYNVTNLNYKFLRPSPDPQGGLNTCPEGRTEYSFYWN